MLPPIAPAPQIRIVAHAQGPSRSVARLLDRDLPDRQHVLVRTLVAAAEIAVAQIFAQRLRAQEPHPGEVDHRLLPGRHRDALEPRPRKILHPGCVRGDRIDLLDLGEGFRRVPPVVELDLHRRMVRHPLDRHGMRRLVAAMAVDHQDAPKAAARQAVQHVANQPGIGLDPQADGAGIGQEIRREAVGHRREDRNAERLRGIERHLVAQDAVDREAEAGVLLGAAERQDRAIVALQIRFDLAPVHRADVHGLPPAMDAASKAWPSASSAPARRSTSPGSGMWR